MNSLQKQNTLVETLKSFVAHSDFIDGIVSSTQAGWGGGGYSVELFPDGTWRVLDDNQIGNLYQPEGAIVSIPQLSESEVEEADDDHFSLRDVAEFYAFDMGEQMVIEFKEAHERAVEDAIAHAQWEARQELSRY